METDEMELDTIGDRKTALFVIISDTDDTFNFVVSILYTQLFNLLCDKADDKWSLGTPTHHAKKGGFHLAYVPVPKDLSKVKTKVALNLTKRQIICFAAALILGLPLFFLLKDSAGTSLASMVMIAVMLPCFLIAMYEKHGQPLEVVVKNIIQTKFIAPKERPYQTENLYAVLERQRKLEKEVSAIAKGKSKHSGKKPRRG